MQKKWLWTLASIMLAAQAAAEDTSSELLADTAVLDHVMVVGSPQRAREATGSAQYLGPEELEKFEYTDVQRALRLAPGVYVVEEDGFGLRPNIGIRGSGLDRNSRITVMEDGVLIAPAAYAAPAAYYFPSTQRIHAIEVRKGSASVQNGPRTTGGAVNLISTPIPQAELAGQASLLFGQDNTLLSHLYAGGTRNRFGYLLETVQQSSDGFKELDGGGDTGYDLQDYVLKLGYDFDAGAMPQRLEFKAVRNSQDSDQTYLGLTDADFRANPFRRYAASQVDRLQVEHELYTLRHNIRFNPALDLTTMAYRHDTARAWYKLNDVRNSANTGFLSLDAVLSDPATFADQYAWLSGDGDSPDGALRVRNNNREYYARGLQTVLAWDRSIGDTSNLFEFGLRWHEDSEDRFQRDDRYAMRSERLFLTAAGVEGGQDNRVGEARARSAFIRDEIVVGRLTLTPGLRYEQIDLTQTSWARQPDGRDLPPTAVARSDVDQFIPALGANWAISDQWSVFSSISKGFNPPAPGSAVDAEESVNYELGVRHEAGALFAEVTAFYNNYSNLVGTCTASTGGGCDIGDQFEGGETLVQGVEASVQHVISTGGALRFPMRATYTWTEAEFRNSFASGFEEWGTVESGDELPYIPEQLFRASAGVEANRWRADLSGSYVGEMRTNAGSGTPPAAERTDSAWIFDLAGGFDVNSQLQLFGKVNNLFDDEYIAARRPAGIMPGQPRTALAGVRLRF